jgi:serine/threonine-protein kinase
MKVLDFGIAKLQMPQPGDSVKTRTGTLMGTPIYMSPEQCRGTKTVDHRSDVYSLGVIFYEMLVGQPPFVSDGFGELVNMHLNVPPQSPRSQRPEISEQLDGIVLKMLAKNPEDRYADMASFTAALKLAQGSAVSLAASSPDLLNAPTQAAATARAEPGRAAKPQVTTFRTGIGEVVDETLQGGSSKRGKIVAVGVAVAVLGVGVFFLTSGSGSKDETHAAVLPPKPAPVAAPAPKAAPAPAAKPPVAPPAKVTVRLATDPQGAKVLDAAGGLVLGTTPFSFTRSKGASIKVRLEKDGYISATREVPLDEDQSLEFALEHKPTPKPKKERREPRDTGPAKL